ncbi:hypothetical protein PVL29_024424 [Vitis rotundifolia]|uniref:Uncharacterized protein n=1 Tax=Vitis rotundifolia TaxID=103349 RepID=A0AA38YRU2_VITRO|nr:hypothetical protein PVL29_024424 [Vitis rotundifolia]
MSFLLKWDAILGLHPNLRNFRKSLVRELVSLQEKLDSPMNQKPEVSVNLTNDVCKADREDEEKDKKATESLQDKSSEDNSDETPNFTEAKRRRNLFSHKHHQDMYTLVVCVLYINSQLLEGYHIMLELLKAEVW